LTYYKELNILKIFSNWKDHAVTSVHCAAWCQANFLTCEISDIMPCAHALNNILHTKCTEKSDDLGPRIWFSGKCFWLGLEKQILLRSMTKYNIFQ